MSDQQPAAIVATISGADLLDRFDKLTSQVGDLARKIDDIPRRMDEAQAKTADHETRIRSIERKLWLASGATGFAGIVVGWLLQVGAYIGGLQ